MTSTVKNSARLVKLTTGATATFGELPSPGSSEYMAIDLLVRVESLQERGTFGPDDANDNGDIVDFSKVSLKLEATSKKVRAQFQRLLIDDRSKPYLVKHDTVELVGSGNTSNRMSKTFNITGSQITGSPKGTTVIEDQEYLSLTLGFLRLEYLQANSYDTTSPAPEAEALAFSVVADMLIADVDSFAHSKLDIYSVPPPTVQEETDVVLAEMAGWWPASVSHEIPGVVAGAEVCLLARQTDAALEVIPEFNDASLFGKVYKLPRAYPLWSSVEGEENVMGTAHWGVVGKFNNGYYGLVPVMKVHNGATNEEQLHALTMRGFAPMDFNVDPSGLFGSAGRYTVAAFLEGQVFQASTTSETLKQWYGLKNQKHGYKLLKYEKRALSTPAGSKSNIVFSPVSEETFAAGDMLSICTSHGMPIHGYLAYTARFSEKKRAPMKFLQRLFDAIEKTEKIVIHVVEVASFLALRSTQNLRNLGLDGPYIRPYWSKLTDEQKMTALKQLDSDEKSRLAKKLGVQFDDLDSLEAKPETLETAPTRPRMSAH